MTTRNLLLFGFDEKDRFYLFCKTVMEAQLVLILHCFLCVHVFAVTRSSEAIHLSSFIKGLIVVADPLNAKCSCAVADQRRFKQLLLCLIYFRLGFKRLPHVKSSVLYCQLPLNQLKALNLKFRAETSDALLRPTSLETSKAAGLLPFKSRKSQSSVLKSSAQAFGSLS